MSTSNPKPALYAQFATVAKAMAHEHRLELLELVAQGEGSGLSIANVSQHLQHLRRAGLVIARRDRKFVLYRLADDGSVLAALSALRHLAERNLGEVSRIVRSYFLERDALEPVSRADLSKRLKTVAWDQRPDFEPRFPHTG
jgi:DNA-binding transcriptional ArsR family regulator